MKKVFLLSSLATALLNTMLLKAASLGLMQPQQKEQVKTLNAHGDHKQMEVPKGQPIPTVKLIVTPDPKEGWNLEIKTTNFKVVPYQENASAMNISEGHVHLYINGKKVTRIYSNDYYLKSLPKGNNKITVSLNTNNHNSITVNGKKVEATKFVVVK
jgi:hypothetical protein